MSKRSIVVAVAMVFVLALTTVAMATDPFVGTLKPVTHSNYHHRKCS
jgi:hypothetical protein